MRRRSLTWLVLLLQRSSGVEAATSPWSCAWATDEFERERVVRQIVQQRIEPVAAESGIVEGEVVAFQDVREQPQAIGAGQTAELVPLRAGQVGIAGAAGDQQAAFARAGGEIAKQFGQTAAFVVGVGIALVGGTVVELRQGALEVVLDHEHILLLEELDGAAALFGGR